MSPRLPAVAPKQAVRALERCGWRFDRTSEAITCSGIRGIGTALSCRCTLVTSPRGRCTQIIEASGVSHDEFLQLI